MKKLFFIAAITGAALVSCTKNEVAPVVAEQSEITFATPVVGNQTKGSLVGETYPIGHGDFKVYAWYHEGDYVHANATGYQTFMSNVTVTYKSDIDDGTTTGSGAWHATPSYYWPKNENAKLSFDAYYPATGITGTVSAKPEAGIQIENFTVASECANQIDVLVSARAWNKENSTSGSNNTYDGVDIQFKHIMSSINFTVSTASDYGTGTIKIKDIIVSADGKATFKQNITGANTEAPKWEAWGANATYNVLTATDAAASISVTTATASVGTEAILIPQGFNPTKTTITVNYYITNNSETPLLQTKTFELTTGTNATVNGTPDTIDGWEQGHKYTYNIVFTLNEVYFAPAVTEWVPVSVAPAI